MEQSIRGKRTEFQKEMVKEQLQQTQLWDIVKFPKMRAESWGIRDTIPIKTSNIDALKIMRDKNLNAIVVVDGKGKYNGIVKRNDIVTDLLLKISESSVK